MKQFLNGNQLIEKSHVSDQNWCIPAVVVKEYVAVREDIPDNGKCLVIIYVDHYGHRLGYLNTMANIAKRDFPELDMNDIHVQKLGGDRRPNGYWAIEFYVPAGHPSLKGYTEISQSYLVK